MILPQKWHFGLKTVTFKSKMCRCGKLFPEAGAQIFFQPGEGAFKGVVVFPV